eukprot:2890316-Rhodomonas_salina.1
MILLVRAANSAMILRRIRYVPTPTLRCACAFFFTPVLLYAYAAATPNQVCAYAYACSTDALYGRRVVPAADVLYGRGFVPAGDGAEQVPA